MLPKYICSTSSCLSVRSALFADCTSKSPFQQLIQNVLGTTRQFWRGFVQNKSKLPNEIVRKQHRLPPEFHENHGGPSVATKFNVSSFAGKIHKVTSRWCSKSPTTFSRAELLRRFYRGGSGPLIGFVGFALAKKPSLLTEDQELEGVSFLIRDAFSSLNCENEGLTLESKFLSEVSLQDLKFEKLIAKGCNAAIYSAHICFSDCENDREKTGVETVKEVIPTQIEMSDIITDSKFLKWPKVSSDDLNVEANKSALANEMKGLKSNIEKDVNCLVGSFGLYDLAVKVMFNYDAESNAYAIWNAMHKETVPLAQNFSFGETWKYKVRKKLKPHPNIVKMYTAFADQLPMLPGAVNNYPIALPPRLLSDGCGRNMTLFLVMKRYNCCLKEYLALHSVSHETALLLFTQLLEALVHLLQNGIVHRDLKSDNILLDLTEGIDSPRLAITDFGCCSESLTLQYTSPDIQKGGNISLMAPEVVNAEPGSFSVIDYSRADLWAAGTIAYEIFGTSNPFYCDARLMGKSNSALRSGSYIEKDLPPFPQKAHPALQNLVHCILSVNPKKRPSPNFAATVCQILLQAPSSLLSGPFKPMTSKKALEWMFRLSAQTYLEILVTNPREPLPLRLELSRTFCSRIQYLEIIDALKYILNS